MYSSIGLPHTSCSTLGFFDFIRVDLPAARMMAVKELIADCQFPISDFAWVDVAVQPAIGNPEIGNEITTRPGFEPGLREPKSLVPPLHYRVMEQLRSSKGDTNLAEGPRSGSP